ncbi:P-II family nitrogen regulator [Nannocystis pusilla]|uniref:P-II family nitrogen regulator n=1 Tax=Nannocystis pusilla TaxID=889268 RepID=A0A9X3IVC7_9BACT|nr:P-II family nitrogen regulator [Nannocystis pusilla]MCY1004319.1 P-II family nitrogen regulator [Nannocystis pusilla]
MKMIVAIIANERLDEVREGLLGVQVAHMTVSRVTGHGRLRDAELYRGVEFVPDLTPKIRVELVVPSTEVERVIRTILENVRDEHGDAKLFVVPLEEVVRVCTGERGIDAL